METRQLDNTDLHITCIGIGAWAFGGGGWQGSMGPQDDGDSISAIHAALDLGINWIDTAALYGFGHSEKLVARAIAGRTPRPLVFTKCKRVWDHDGNIGACLKAESIRRECEDSLRRLKTNIIDLYQIHWPKPDADIEEGWTELAKLKKQGKVRHIGVSNFCAFLTNDSAFITLCNVSDADVEGLARNWGTPRPYAGRNCNCLGAQGARDHRSNRGLSQSAAAAGGL